MKLTARDPRAIYWNVVDRETGEDIPEVFEVDTVRGTVARYSSHGGRFLLNPDGNGVATEYVTRPIRVIDTRTDREVLLD